MRLTNKAFVTVVILIVVGCAGGGWFANWHEVALLKSILNEVPIPAGATMTSQNSSPCSSYSKSYVQRTYLLPEGTDVDSQVLQKLKDAGYQPVNSMTHQIDTTGWQQVTGHEAYGGIMVTPPDRPKAYISLVWSSPSNLNVSLAGGSAFWTGK